MNSEKEIQKLIYSNSIDSLENKFKIEIEKEKMKQKNLKNENSDQEKKKKSFFSIFLNFFLKFFGLTSLIRIFKRIVYNFLKTIKTLFGIKMICILPYFFLTGLSYSLYMAILPPKYNTREWIAWSTSAYGIGD
jgi:hypothetical protein